MEMYFLGPVVCLVFLGGGQDGDERYLDVTLAIFCVNVAVSAFKKNIWFFFLLLYPSQ